MTGIKPELPASKACAHPLKIFSISCLLIFTFGYSTDYKFVSSTHFVLTHFGGVTPGCAQGSILAELGRIYGVLGIKSRLVLCKESVLPVVLLHQPFLFTNFKDI